MATQERSNVQTKVFTAPYRPDIDGLRAIAVASVVLYHAFPNIVEGGFIGVDVFFVISGYLISSIIMKGVLADNFTFIGFYKRRVRRIFGALFVIMVFCLAAGWAILFADEYKALGKHVVGGAGFVSNLVLWSESGYFDTVAETKPLLHLWSLGIEEQFYIIWPIIIIVLSKTRKWILAPLAAITLLSFLSSLIIVHSDAVAGFYSPLARFWELSAGACLAQLRMSAGAPLAQRLGRRVAHAAAMVGALFLLYGVVFISRTDPFPGALALIPVIGALLLIAAGSGAWFNRSVLSTRPFVLLGLISYPLYLWHWPLFVFARIINGDEPGGLFMVGLIGLATAAAALTYQIVEKPVRFGPHGSAKAIGLFGAVVMAAAAGGFVYAHDGLAQRAVIGLNSIAATGFDGGAKKLMVTGCGIASPEDQSVVPTCISDTREPARLALIGDSKALALVTGLMRTSEEGARWLFVGGTKGNTVTVPALSSTHYGRSQRAARIALDAVKQNSAIDTVLIATATRELFNLPVNYSLKDLPESPYYEPALSGLSSFVEELAGAGKKVVLLVDNPTLPDPKECIIRNTSLPALDALFGPRTSKCHITVDEHLRLSQKYRKMLDEIVARNPTVVSQIDTIPVLCDMDARLCSPYKNGRLIYEYSDHISDYGAGLVGREVNAVLAPKLTGRPTGAH